MKTLLAAVVVIGLAAVAGAVLVGTRVFEDTVVENPYERGLNWDRERREAASCDLNAGPCTAVTGKSGTEIALEITPRPLRTMVPLQFTVAFAGEAGGIKEDVTVDLSMPGMFMGENTVRLAPEGERLWTGMGVVVRCPSGGKTWRAEVSLPGRESAAFTFEVDR